MSNLNPKLHKANGRLWVLGRAASFAKRLAQGANKRFTHFGEWQVDICSGKPNECIDHRRVYGTNQNNWGFLLQGILGSYAASATPELGLVDKSNASSPVNTASTYKTAYGCFNNEYGIAVAAAYYAWVELGVGGSTTSRADADLNTPSTPVSTPTVTAAYNTGQVTLSATATYASGISPTEVGIFLHCYDVSNAMDDYLLDHTTFSALASNTAFTITYSIALG